MKAAIKLSIALFFDTLASDLSCRSEMVARKETSDLKDQVALVLLIEDQKGHR